MRVFCQMALKKTEQILQNKIKNKTKKKKEDLVSICKVYFMELLA